MSIIEKHKKEKIYFQIKDFESAYKINHLFSSRIGWNQKNIFKDLSKVLNLSEEKIYRLKQVHGNKVISIKNQDYKEICKEEKDGLITDVKGIVLASYHADCVPLYFHDPVKEAIGLAHAGWKGTLNNISKSLVEKMQKEYKSNIKDIRVAIGPSICLFCYEIGEELVEEFLNKYENKNNLIVEKDKKYYLNLWLANKINLIEMGIEEKNIYESEYCTSCNIDKLYSYRKEKATKNRMIAAIQLGVD